MTAMPFGMLRATWLRGIVAGCCLAAVGGVPWAASCAQDARTQQILRRFPQADANRDGRLDAEELRALMRMRRGGDAPAAPETKPAPGAATPSSSAAPVSVAIAAPPRPARINPRVYGLNCAEMITKGLLDVPEYVETIAALRLKTLQFPGGSASYWHHPTGAGGLNARPEEVKKSARGEQSRWMEQTSGPDRFGQYLELCRRSGAEALFIANIMHGNPEELDAFLQRISAANVGLAAVALGQEMHLAPGGVGLGLEEYLRRIGPHIELLRSKYPGVLIAAPATPVGRVEGRRREGLHEWNQALARVAGLDGFTQYGWTEFGGMARLSGWPAYRDFVRDFPAEQLPVYHRDFGPDKKFLMTQWGTHGDQNTPLQGVHLGQMYFFLVRYNAAHGDYFAAANLSIPLAAVSGLSGRAKSGIPHGDRVTLLAAYVYNKPFRHLFDGQTVLLDARLSEAGDAQALAARAADGTLLVYLLNPGPRRPLGGLAFDGRAVPPGTVARVEAAFAADERETGPLAVFEGERALREVVLEPWSLTLLRLPPPSPRAEAEPAPSGGNAKQVRNSAILSLTAEHPGQDLDCPGTLINGRGPAADLTDSTLAFAEGGPPAAIPSEPDGHPAADRPRRDASGPRDLADRPRRGRAPLAPPPGVTEKEFVYKKTPQGELKLIVTFPADWKPADRRPGAIFFSGGAWANSLINQFEDRAQYFAGRGMVTARADYRAFKSHGTGPDKAVEDARSAVRWLRAHAAELGLDPNRLAAGGSSAGGHLAACTATPVAPDDPADNPQVACAPNALLMVNCVADFKGMEESEKFLQRVAGGAAMGERLSPARHLGPKWPPTLILDGDRDRWFSLAQTVVDKLAAEGVRAELWIAPGEGHPFSNFSPWREASIAKMDEFLASLGWLKGPPTIEVPPGAAWVRHRPAHPRGPGR